MKLLAVESMASFTKEASVDDLKIGDLKVSVDDLKVGDLKVSGEGVLYEAGKTTLLSSQEDLDQFKILISTHKLVAFDSDGVDLSREGRVTLISIGILVDGGVHVFLIDPIHKDVALRIELLTFTKEILENEEIVKIVHDCRQDSDALHRTLTPSISLTNVFDTQVWAMRVSRTTKRDNLNNALINFNCGGINAARTGSCFNIARI